MAEQLPNGIQVDLIGLRSQLFPGTARLAAYESCRPLGRRVREPSGFVFW
jgi:hypothetical protein